VFIAHKQIPSPEYQNSLLNSRQPLIKDNAKSIEKKLEINTGFIPDKRTSEF
jgi:hypothetical protein